MIEIMVRCILGIYPPWWKRRYGEESADLAEDLLEEPGAHRWRVIASLLSGSLLAWMQLRRIGDYLKPVSSPNEWGYVPTGSHRDIFGNRGLWPRSEAELEPDEVLLGVVDGLTGSRWIVNMPIMGMAYLLGPLAALLVERQIASAHSAPIPWFLLMWGAAFLSLGLVLRPLTNSYNVSVAVTSHGVVVFRRGVTGRTGKMVERMPPVEPELVKRGMMRRVRLGQRTIWLNDRSDPLLYWMSQTLRSSAGQ